MELSNEKSTPSSPKALDTSSTSTKKRFDDVKQRDGKRFLLFDKRSTLYLMTILFVFNAFCAGVARAERVEILMSNVTTQQEDAYLCTSYKFTEDQNYITNVEPLTNANIAHHMFAFGCDKPASSSLSWNCGDLVCQGQKTILFAWGRNAPSLVLPDGKKLHENVVLNFIDFIFFSLHFLDVAFKVGTGTTFKYIVVNVHYLKKVENDRSGLAISVTNKP